MDSEEGNAAARRILRIVLVLRDATVKEQTEIQIEEHLGVLIDTAFAAEFSCVQDVHTMQILELADDLRQLGDIARRADVYHADIHLRIEDSCERLEFK